MILCNDCQRELESTETRYAFGEPYCESCFDEVFAYCSRCEEIIYRSDAHYDGEGDALCNSCYESNYDDDSPNNPDVFSDDREFILALSRNWIAGNLSSNSFIHINRNDHDLSRIRSKVGLVQNPVYIYGLRDRDEYNLTASDDIREKLTQFLNSKGYYLHIEEASGRRRIGISLSFRQSHFHLIVELLKHVTLEAIRQERGEICAA